MHAPVHQNIAYWLAMSSSRFKNITPGVIHSPREYNMNTTELHLLLTGLQCIHKILQALTNPCACTQLWIRTAFIHDVPSRNHTT